MRELLLGAVVVALLAGIIVGRRTERARRLVKDWSVAKAAVPKGRTVAFTEVRRAALTVIVAGGILLALFFGAMNLR